MNYDALRAVPTPQATDSHVPIPHHELVELVRYTLGFYGHEIAEEAHAIAADGSRYFGLMTLRSPYGDYSDTLGLRNSHDKSFPIGVAHGSRVFVCDNLAFVGDTVIKRKHTSKAKKELPGLITEIIQPLQEQRIAQNQKLLAYKETELADAVVDHAVLDLYRKDVIGIQAVAHVLKAYEEPPHDWGGRTAWRLFNAATFALAGKVAERPDLTKQLHTVIDGTCTRLQ
ncbi:DUF932 domain-containing protein [Bradyrhizobium sp. ORS 285]|uniref:DUF932 domain-containing protein n=1 Tax=Bradyrhizobium sp. ORS 285 TaxID=115808 RepID=UPI0018D52DBE|nr:DUF932 domain-containing protein [Bradyrhizobium sp. ORS 285]